MMNKISCLGKPSCPNLKEWFFGWSKAFKEKPVREGFKFILKLPIVLIAFVKLHPFITDWPYAIAFVFPFVWLFAFENTRKLIQKSLFLTFLAGYIVFFLLTKPILFPANPDNPLFNAKFFKFENYNICMNVHDEKSIKVNGRDYDPQACSHFFSTSLSKIFPLGTKKEYVDKVLVEQGKAFSSPLSPQQKQEIVYNHEGSWTPWPSLWSSEFFFEAGWIVIVSYNEKNEVDKIAARIGFSSL